MRPSPSLASCHRLPAKITNFTEWQWKWNSDIQKYTKLLNAKAMWLFFAAFLDTEESERNIVDIALMSFC